MFMQKCGYFQFFVVSGVKYMLLDFLCQENVLMFLG